MTTRRSRECSAAFIRSARQAMGITQSQLAALMDCDIRTVQKWEGAERTMPGPAVLALRALLWGWRPGQTVQSMPRTPETDYLYDTLQRLARDYGGQTSDR